MTSFNKYNRYSKYFLFAKRNSPYKKLLAFKRSKWKKFQKTFKSIIRRNKKIFYFRKNRKKSRYKYKYRTRLRKRIKIFRSKNKKFIKLEKKRKKSLARRLNRNFPNFLSKDIRSKRWRRFLKNYKSGLSLKQSLFCFYNNSVSFRFFKNQLKKKDNLVAKYLVRPLLTLEVFLWKLRLFHSTRQLKQYISSKNIMINGNNVKFNRLLRGGDIVSFSNLKFNRPSFKFLPIFFYSFCEFDFYTNTFIVLKDISVFSKKDFRFFIEYKKIHLNVLEYYLSKK